MKKLVFTSLYVLGVTRLFRWLNRKRVVILCYHGVTGSARRGWDDTAGMHIVASRFEAQLEHLQRNYSVISLRDYLASLRGETKLPDKAVVITFDDGYRNFYSMVAPRVLQRNIPVSLFLTTGKITNNGSLSSDWKPTDDKHYLSWQEVRSLKERGIEIGSHTCSHPKLTEIPTDEADQELTRSRDEIIKQLPTEELPFAYPYGDYSSQLADLVRSAGYSCALTTDAGVNELDADRFSLRRVLIGDSDDVPVFAARVAGLAALLARGRGAAPS